MPPDCVTVAAVTDPDEKLLYLEDLTPGLTFRSERFRLEREQIIAFAREWDPQPWHLDDEAARESIFGELTASAVHIFAIQGRLIIGIRPRMAVLAGLGNDGMEFRVPACVGDELHVETSVVKVRPSQSKPDRGIAHIDNRVRNQRDEVVLYSKGKIMVATRPR